MSRTCDLIASKQVTTGHKVSHSNRKANRRFIPNLQDISLVSEVLKQKISLRIAASTLRSIEKHGGIDQFLTATANSKLTSEGQKLKKKIAKAQAA